MFEKVLKNLLKGFTMRYELFCSDGNINNDEEKATKMSDNIHEGHRDRMRERVKNGGIDSLESHEILEFLLYHVIPRRNTNDLAHMLISKFGSLANVLNASADDLVTVSGITKNAAVFLAALPGVYRAYLRSLNEERPLLDNRDALVKFLRGYFSGKNEEAAYLICLDAHNKLTSVQKLGSGGASYVQISVRDICDAALRLKAVSVVLAHNHPSGVAEPSDSDIMMTQNTAIALKSIDVELLDHLILAGETNFSFRDSGLAEFLDRHVESLLDDSIINYLRPRR
ncbi:MAG: DNA repair protein RadC [Clostridiaceae bacterium]|nr:DNA repair protein RadC [Clostridiaceae bacterium]